MKNFEVIGLKKREYRGNHLPMVTRQNIEAENKQEAGWEFEKSNPEYKAQDINEIAAIREKKTKKQEQTEE